MQWKLRDENAQSIDDDAPLFTIRRDAAKII